MSPCMLLYICVRSLVMSTAIASLLGVKFGYQSNDKPCRRRRSCKLPISWYIYCTVRVDEGGKKDNASTGMKNNVNPIVETLGWAGGSIYKAER